MLPRNRLFGKLVGLCLSSHQTFIKTHDARALARTNNYLSLGQHVVQVGDYVTYYLVCHVYIRHYRDIIKHNILCYIDFIFDYGVKTHLFHTHYLQT